MPNVAQSVDACTVAVNYHAEARAKQPFSLGHAPASNMLVRGLHIQGTRWRGLLLCMVNSPSVRVTAAPRRDRQICPVGLSRGVGFAHLGLHRSSALTIVAYCRDGRRTPLSEETLSLAAPTSRAAAKPPRPLTSLAPLACRGAGAAPLGKRHLASRRRLVHSPS